MPRSMSSGLIEKISSPVVNPVFFMHGEFPDGEVRLSSLGTSIEWRGHEWRGTGELVRITPIEDTSNLQSKKIKVILSNIPVDILQKAFIKAPEYPGRIWFGALDTESGLLVDEPALIFSGRIDGVSLLDQTDSGALEITYQSVFFNPSGIAAWRHSEESHQQLHPGDETHRFVTGLNDLRQGLPWGRSA